MTAATTDKITRHIISCTKPVVPMTKFVLYWKNRKPMFRTTPKRKTARKPANNRVVARPAGLELCLCIGHPLFVCVFNMIIFPYLQIRQSNTSKNPVNYRRLPNCLSYGKNYGILNGQLWLRGKCSMLPCAKDNLCACRVQNGLPKQKKFVFGTYTGGAAQR